MAVVKFSAWRIPGQAGREERWDAEIVQGYDEHRRITGLPKENVEQLIAFVEGLLRKQTKRK